MDHPRDPACATHMIRTTSRSTPFRKLRSETLRSATNFHCQGREGGEQPFSTSTPRDQSLPHVKGKLLLHHHTKQKKVVFLSLDLETGGEECCIIQLSGKIIRPEITRDGGYLANDTLSNVTREGTLYHPETNPGGEAFNAYVNPREDAVWSSHATEVTGLSHTDKRIT